MRILAFFSVAALMLAQLGHAAPQAVSEDGANKLDGEWELVSFKYGAAPVQSLSNNRREIKLISGTHFVWVVYDTKKHKPISVGGGTCSRQGDQYTEQVEFGDIRTSTVLGKPQVFHITTDGHNWRHSGVLSDGLSIEETWRLVE